MLCAWCSKPIKGDRFHVHEVFVKRSSGLPLSRIRDVHNCVPMHAECHSRYGQTRQALDKAREYLLGVFSEEELEEWIEWCKTDLGKSRSS